MRIRHLTYLWKGLSIVHMGSWEENLLNTTPGRSILLMEMNLAESPAPYKLKAFTWYIAETKTTRRCKVAHLLTSLPKVFEFTCLVFHGCWLRLVMIAIRYDRHVIIGGGCIHSEDAVY